MKMRIKNNENFKISKIEIKFKIQNSKVKMESKN